MTLMIKERITSQEEEYFVQSFLVVSKLNASRQKYMKYRRKETTRKERSQEGRSESSLLYRTTFSETTAESYRVTLQANLKEQKKKVELKSRIKTL